MSALAGLGLLVGIPTAAQTFTRMTTGSVISAGGSTHGCAWADYDNDGWPDLFAANRNGQNNFLFRNEANGAFTRITGQNMVSDDGDSVGCAWGDYDNDGWLDLFVANYYEDADFLYHNNGNGTFARVAAGLLISSSEGGNACAWGDYDNDGFVDLCLGGQSGSTNLLFRNNGNGTFTKTAALTGAATGNPRGLAWGDYDNDGWLDLFVATEGGPNFLYHNDGPLGFRRITTGPIGTDVAQSHGCAWGDYDNDGFLDLFVANDGQNNFLYRNSGDGTFTRMLFGPVVADGGASRTGAWGDYDNDGYLDLFVVNGDAQSDFLYHNNGNGTFTKVTTESPTTDASRGYGAAWEDYDNDGYLDLYVANHYNENDLLYHNHGGTNNWFKVRCVGTASNRQGVGARLTVQTVRGPGVLWQIRDMLGGDGYSGQSLVAKFGLGQATQVERLQVRWPSGALQELPNLAANQTLVVTENVTGTVSPQLRSPCWLGEGQLQFWLVGEVGLTYSIEATRDWRSWEVLARLTISATNGLASFSDAAAGDFPFRGYRAAGQ